MKQRKRLRPRQAPVPRELRAAAAVADDADWWIEVGGGGHLKWGVGDVMKVVTSKTPGPNPQTIKNTLTKLRKAGLDV